MLEPEERELAVPALETATAVKEQDVELDENGKASLIKGVAKDKRISIEDAAWAQKPERARGWIQAPCAPRPGYGSDPCRRYHPGECARGESDP